MALSQSSPFSAIVLAIQQQLINCTGLSNTQVRIAASQNYELSTQDSQFIIIVCSGIQPDSDSGVGRRARYCQRTITTYIYSRNNLDFYGSDYHALTNTNAHYSLEENVLSSLDQFWPVGENGNLSIETVQVLSPPEGQVFRKPEDDSTGLVRSELLFSIKYVLDQPTQIPLPPNPSVIYPE